MKVNKILAIAVCEYENEELNKLNNCFKDVTSLVQILNEKYQFDDIELITTNADTSRKALYRKLNEYFSNCLDDESVVLIYAGHGEYNPKLDTAFWLPSDADPLYPETWFNITDLMSFLRASDAFHISLISDSCFSGAIFQAPSRGGGANALSSKKSRVALTSGSLEKVSDGKEGENSPFATTLINILTENSSSELPFSMLANNVILDFNAERKQTPMFGSLERVGHDGGSFIFRLKHQTTKNEQKDADKIIQFMNNLYLNVTEEDRSTLDEIKPFRQEKLRFVQQQNYEEAAKFRAEEKIRQDSIFEKIPKTIQEIIGKVDITLEEQENSKFLDLEIQKYEIDLETKSDIYKRRVSEMKMYTDEPRKRMLISNFQALQLQNPASIYFQKCKQELFDDYKKNIRQMYIKFIKIKSTSKSLFLTNKLKNLDDIMVKIYNFELKLLSNDYPIEVEDNIQLKEIDIEVLNWIKNS